MDRNEGTSDPPSKSTSLEPENNSQTSSPSDRMWHRCDQCGYATDRRNNLQRHLRAMHTPSAVQECCGCFFRTKVDLRRHTKTFHRSGFACPMCGHPFPRRAQLRRHFSVHTGIKPFKCPHCAYVTNNKSNLERHGKVHKKDHSKQLVQVTNLPSEPPSIYPESSTSSNTQISTPQNLNNSSLSTHQMAAGPSREVQNNIPTKIPSVHTIEAILQRPSTRIKSMFIDNTESDSSSSSISSNNCDTSDDNYVPKKLRMAKKYVQRLS